jgi:hypothetical protein
MRDQCAPAELFPDIPTRPSELVLELLTDELSPLIEDIAEKLKTETPRAIRYQCALWVL